MCTWYSGCRHLGCNILKYNEYNFVTEIEETVLWEENIIIEEC